MIKKKTLTIGLAKPVEVNEITGKNFRLVHDIEKVIAIIEGSARSTTLTKSKVAEYETEKNLLTAVETLGLTNEEVAHDLHTRGLLAYL